MERSRPKGTDGSDYAYRMTIDNSKYCCCCCSCCSSSFSSSSSSSCCSCSRCRSPSLGSLCVFLEIGIQCGQLFRVLMWKRSRRVQESSRGQGPLPQVHISSGTDTDAQRDRERSVLCNCRSLLLLSSRETLTPFFFFFFFFFFFEHLRCREIFSVSVCYFGVLFLL
jgi:hypothetical protein